MPLKSAFVTMRPIRFLGDPVLRTPSDPVTSFDDDLRALVTDLLDTLLGADGRAGVAAPQIGVPAAGVRVQRRRTGRTYR